MQFYSLCDALLGTTLLALPMWTPASLWRKFNGREALGFGDVKLLAMLGLFMGPYRGYVVLLIASTSGALFGVGHWLLKRNEAANYEIPFGRFLCASAALISFFC
jgi:leader peptidase (prepilin peptidase) / N-methyltransferase